MRIGIPRNHHDAAQLGVRAQRIAQGVRRVERPQVLVLEVDERARVAERLDVRARDAAFALRRERIRLAGTRDTCAGSAPHAGPPPQEPRLGRKGTALGRLGGEAVHQRADGVGRTEWRRVLPALAECPRHVGDRGTAQRELHVVPRRRVAVALVPEVHGLRVAVMVGVVAATVREVDAADERNVLVGLGS